MSIEPIEPRRLDPEAGRMQRLLTPREELEAEMEARWQAMDQRWDAAQPPAERPGWVPYETSNPIVSKGTLLALELATYAAVDQEVERLVANQLEEGDEKGIVGYALVTVVTRILNGLLVDLDKAYDAGLIETDHRALIRAAFHELKAVVPNE